MASPIEVGKYVMYGAIASGGMASVHFGRMRGPRGFARTVAIKRLHPALAGDAELGEALAAEARLCARIRHPNVVSVLDVVEHDHDLYLVMELVSAVPLSILMRRAREQGSRVPPPVAVAIVSAVLRGLGAAHELGVVHRDVSPQNVLVGADGVPRLVDFGIAKVESQGTRGTSLKGKPGYMSPEQLRGESVDRRADVYAASVVLWELLTGSRLFAGDNDHAVMLKVLERRVDAPGRIVGALPDALDQATLRGLARDREQRFPSAEAMATELERAIVPATAREVGSFVAGLCATDLEALESQANALEASDPVTTERDGGKRLAIVVVTALALGAGVVAWAGLRGGRVPAAEPVTPSAAAPVAMASAPEPASPAVAAADAAPANSVEKPRHRPSKPLTKPATVDCDPPYVVDPEGFQHMKPQCL